MELISNVLEVVKRRIHELKRDGKEPAVILMSRRTRDEVANDESGLSDLVGWDKIYGVPVEYIDGIEGHFIQVLEERPMRSEYNDLYSQFEKEVIKAQQRGDEHED